MGCISSKRATPTSPVFDDLREVHGKFRSASQRRNSSASDGLRQSRNYRETSALSIRRLSPGEEVNEIALFEEKGEKKANEGILKRLKSSKSKRSSSNFSINLKFGSTKSTGDFATEPVVEQVSAGWPGWLTAVAGEAIQGWAPRRADEFEKLEKIGQGTYSSVYRAKEHATGRIVALKKVRFDNYHPESVRFMSREITILRKLDHPNIMKLLGLITSKTSCSIYLVFEYMEHDLAGLLSSPDVEFTESQIKCFMQQILYALDYCHRRGVMHRDIKTSNILLNNEGVLKLGDFGLANFISARYKQPLTSRVVTLWYRPPELLLGSTNYGAYVDLWSVGCVLAELLIGKPILKGKTEVEQLHKIFKLCGSPPEEYWEKSKLPHATMFKPQTPYESSLRERCKSLPEHTIAMLETFLSVEPQLRGTAASTLNSTYFTTMPYACDPSSLPKYPPNKEIDAKSREESKRRRTGRPQDSTTSSRMHRRARKGLQDPTSFSMLGRPGLEEPQVNRKYARRNGINSLVSRTRKGDDEISIDMKSNVSHLTNVSQGDMMMFTNSERNLAKKKIVNDQNNLLFNSKSINNFDSSSVLHANKMLDPHPEENENENENENNLRDFEVGESSSTRL